MPLDPLDPDEAAELVEFPIYPNNTVCIPLPYVETTEVRSLGMHHPSKLQQNCSQLLFPSFNAAFKSPDWVSYGQVNPVWEATAMMRRGLFDRSFVVPIHSIRYQSIKSTVTVCSV